MKIPPVEAELLRAERQTDGQITDMTKQMFAFRNSRNAPKYRYYLEARGQF